MNSSHAPNHFPALVFRVKKHVKTPLVVQELASGSYDGHLEGLLTPVDARSGDAGETWGCVCVCVHPWTKGSQPTSAGGHSSFHQSVANEATDDWRGYEPGTPGSRTCSPFSTVDKLSTLAFLVFMVLHDTFPQTYSSPAAAPPV